jgi:hypothetical protein
MHVQIRPYRSEIAVSASPLALSGFLAQIPPEVGFDSSKKIGNTPSLLLYYNNRVISPPRTARLSVTVEE